MKLKAFKARGGGHCQQQISIFGLVRGHAVHPGRALAERFFKGSRHLKASQGLANARIPKQCAIFFGVCMCVCVYLEHSNTAFYEKNTSQPLGPHGAPSELSMVYPKTELETRSNHPIIIWFQ